LNKTVNSLTLNFVESYITKVEIVNVLGDEEERLNGAKIKMNERICGTVNDTSKGRRFIMDCNMAGSSVMIELQNNWLQVAEVKIYGRG
jgi:hypothetical protein